MVVVMVDTCVTAISLLASDSHFFFQNNHLLHILQAYHTVHAHTETFCFSNFQPILPPVFPSQAIYSTQSLDISTLLTSLPSLNKS